MENIKEDLCFSCRNKSDIREVLSRLELIHDRIVSLEVTQKIACTMMNGVKRTQKRHFDTLMSQCRGEIKNVEPA